MSERSCVVAPPLFIVGCDRSGTTLLRLMMAQSPELHIPRETGFIPELWERRDEYGDFRDARGRWFFIRDLQHTRATSKTRAFDALGLSLEVAEAALAEAAPTDYSGAVAALYAAGARSVGKVRWGDKTPRYVLHVPLLSELFPGSQFIHIIRDPRDVAASIVASGWAGGSFRRAAETWLERVSAGREAGRALGPERYREIHYEALLGDPEGELRKLAQWTRITYTPRMLAFFEHAAGALPEEHLDLFRLIHGPVDPSRAFAWRRTLGRSALGDVEAVAGGLMAELGYERTGARVPAWVEAARYLTGAGLRFAGRLRLRGLMPSGPEFYPAGRADV